MLIPPMPETSFSLPLPNHGALRVAKLHVSAGSVGLAGWCVMLNVITQAVVPMGTIVPCLALHLPSQPSDPATSSHDLLPSQTFIPIFKKPSSLSLSPLPLFSAF